LFVLIATAQVPQAFNYQAVARNNAGQIVPSQNIGVRFTIHDQTATGTIVYQETHATTTNNVGLFTLGIGRGTVVSGTFSSINWATGDKYLQVEIAPAGGTNYTVQGTTQFLSVPYALYAAKTNIVAGNNTITVANGNTITGNYQAGNNTITINGNAIAGNYQAGTGISITGNTIAHNFVAGTGISIAGNVISATGASSLWTTDAAGIHNTNASGHVGINRNATSVYPLTVHQNNSAVGNAIAYFESDDTWHGAVAIKNNPSNSQFSFTVAGTQATLAVRPGSLQLFHSPAVGNSQLLMAFDAVNHFVGIGPRDVTTIVPGSYVPRSTLHIFSGDVNIEQINSGIIMKSPNGQCWRVTIDNSGNLVRTSIACP
jgi:hypothetical protein